MLSLNKYTHILLLGGQLLCSLHWKMSEKEYTNDMVQWVVFISVWSELLSVKSYKKKERMSVKKCIKNAAKNVHREVWLHIVWQRIFRFAYFTAIFNVMNFREIIHLWMKKIILIVIFFQCKHIIGN